MDSDVDKLVPATMDKAKEGTFEEDGTSEVEGVIEKKKAQEEKQASKVHPYMPPIPYPARLKKNKDQEQFGKFLDLFKQLHINLPLVEVLSQMPRYAKFLKDLLSNKKKLEEISTAPIGAGCSAILLNKLPKKLKDPGSFTIPCLIGDMPEERALADLGASINLMPYSMFKQLGLGELKPTRMSLQLADRSIKFPKGIIEDVLVKVENFIFPVDFVILDMSADVEVPLILGRPFLAIARAVIDVADGKLILRVGDDELTVQIHAALKHLLIGDDSCYAIDSVDMSVVSSMQEFLCKDSLEFSLTEEKAAECKDYEIQGLLAQLEATKEIVGKKGYEKIATEGEAWLKPSIEEPPVLELKQLPDYLEYAFLGENSKLPVIISAGLTGELKDRLLNTSAQ